MQLYFIRHGQSVNNAHWETDEYKDTGRTADPVLTQKGIEQAKLTAEFLAQSHPEVTKRWIDPQNNCEFGLTHLYCSLMERAVQTGLVIANRLGIDLNAQADMHEIGGIFLKEQVGDEEIVHIQHGHARPYFERHYPKLILPEEVDSRGWWPGGIEPRENEAVRAKRIIDFLLEKHLGTDDRVGVITHGGIYRKIFMHLFNVQVNGDPDFRMKYRIILNNCAISRYDFDEESMMLLYHNRTDFLPCELIT